jgi:hypothetical protein
MALELALLCRGGATALGRAGGGVVSMDTGELIDMVPQTGGCFTSVGDGAVRMYISPTNNDQVVSYGGEGYMFSAWDCTIPFIDIEEGMCRSTTTSNFLRYSAGSARCPLGSNPVGLHELGELCANATAAFQGLAGCRVGPGPRVCLSTGSPASSFTALGSLVADGLVAVCSARAGTPGLQAPAQGGGVYAAITFYLDPQARCTIGGNTSHLSCHAAADAYGLEFRPAAVGQQLTRCALAPDGAIRQYSLSSAPQFATIDRIAISNDAESATSLAAKVRELAVGDDSLHQASLAHSHGPRGVLHDQITTLPLYRGRGGEAPSVSVWVNRSGLACPPDGPDMVGGRVATLAAIAALGGATPWALELWVYPTQGVERVFGVGEACSPNGLRLSAYLVEGVAGKIVRVVWHPGPPVHSQSAHVVDFSAHILEQRRWEFLRITNEGDGHIQLRSGRVATKVGDVMISRLGHSPNGFACSEWGGNIHPEATTGSIPVRLTIGATVFEGKSGH